MRPEMSNKGYVGGEELDRCCMGKGVSEFLEIPVKLLKYALIKEKMQKKIVIDLNYKLQITSTLKIV
jgi:hypothetical protein